MAEKMICPVCGIGMNHHAEKLVYSIESVQSDPGGTLEAFHSCPQCGRTETQKEATIPRSFF